MHNTTLYAPTSALTSEDTTAAIQFLAEHYGNPTSYGYIFKRNGHWVTAKVSAGKGEKRLPISTGRKGDCYMLPLKPADIIKAYESQSIIGKRPGSIERGKTNHFTLDIDRESPYHPENDPMEWARLITLIEADWNLSIQVVTSSASGGLHILAFFRSAMWSLAIAKQLKQLLEGNGFTIRPGTLETFPNVPKSADGWMNGVRLPCLTPESCLVDPYTLEPIGWRNELVQAAQKALEHNAMQRFLRLNPQSIAEPAQPVPAPVRPAKANPEGFEQPAPEPVKTFNLAHRFHWSPTCRSNQVIGAHTAEVIEVERIYDPVEAEARVWERLYQYGYSENASSNEQRDRDHVRRWVAHCLRKVGKLPLGNPGRGDKRLNQKRSEDAIHRLRLALKGLRKQTFATATALWEAANQWLKDYKFKGIGKTTFWKLKLLWVGALVRAKLSRWGSTPTLDQRKGQDDAQTPVNSTVLTPLDSHPTGIPRDDKQGVGWSVGAQLCLE
jgi:hypothetical protein